MLLSSIVFIIGNVNLILEVYSRNIFFTYLAFVCYVVSILLLFGLSNIFAKLIAGLSIISLMILSIVSAIYHIIIGGTISDYVFILIQAICILMLMIMRIIHEKKTSSIEEGLFSLEC